MDPHIQNNAHEYIELFHKYVRPFSRPLLLYLKPVYAGVSIGVPGNCFEELGSEKQAEIVEWVWI